jgi:hypothetical protein
MNTRFGARPLFLALVTLGMSGCFAYHEVAPASIEPGDEVRVTVDREVALDLAEQTGEVRTSLAGRVTEQTNDAAVGLSFAVSGSAFRDFAALPREGIVRIEERRLSALRSAGLAVLTGAVAAIVLSVTEGGDNDGQGEVPPVNQQLRIPLIRFGF